MKITIELSNTQRNFLIAVLWTQYNRALEPYCTEDDSGNVTLGEVSPGTEQYCRTIGELLHLLGAEEHRTRPY
jgi:hypothetical protein